MAIGIAAAAAMMVLMLGSMLFLGHRTHKRPEESKQDARQETSVKGSTMPANGMETIMRGSPAGISSPPLSP